MEITKVKLRTAHDINVPAKSECVAKHYRMAAWLVLNQTNLMNHTYVKGHKTGLAKIQHATKHDEINVLKNNAHLQTGSA